MTKHGANARARIDIYIIGHPEVIVGKGRSLKAKPWALTGRVRFALCEKTGRPFMQGAQSLPTLSKKRAPNSPKMRAEPQKFEKGPLASRVLNNISAAQRTTSLTKKYTDALR